MDYALNSEYEEIGLKEWRRKATDVVLIVSAIVHFPLLLTVLSDYFPGTTRPFKILTIAIYAMLIVLVVLRRVSYRIRVRILLLDLFFFALVSGAVFPLGPVARFLPVIAPILAIVLYGRRAGRISAAVSSLILIFSPALRLVPGFARIFCAENQLSVVLQKHIWAGSLGLTSIMLVLFVLLEHFYGFLLEALHAQRQTFLKLDAEIKERHVLEREITKIGDEERRRLGYEVHDGICQQLTGALLRCGTLELRAQTKSPLSPEEIGNLRRLLGETLVEARSVAHGLCPLEPDPDALAPGLRSMAQKMDGTTSVSCTFDCEGDVHISNPSTANHLYRLAQEALSNAIQHSCAGKICIRLQGTREALVLQVEDNGTGVSRDHPLNGMGLQTMKYRAQMIGGEFVIKDAPGGGTIISCRVPRMEEQLQ